MALTQKVDELIPELRGYQRQLLIAGAAAGLVSLIGLWSNPRQFFQSYLIGYVFVLGITLGCLAISMLHQLSGGAWGLVIRQIAGASSRLLPILTVAFLPIVFGMPYLYEWTHADVVARHELLQHKSGYLNTTFFLVRATFYFAVWNGVSYFLNAWSLEQDLTGNPAIERRLRKLGAGGLLAYGLTITFASFDWLMSLEPEWFSTIYGILIIGGQGLSALAFMIVALVWLSRRPPLRDLIAPAHFHDLGNLMLAFVMLWAYFGFSQYLITWSGNLPEEIVWYTHRLQTSWRYVGLALVVFHFAVPFALLLSRAVKREAEMIVKVALGILVVRVVDLQWLVAPGFHPEGLAVSWLDIVLPLSLVAIWLGCFVWQLRGRTILPVHDPQFEDALGKIEFAGERPSSAHSS